MDSLQYSRTEIKQESGEKEDLTGRKIYSVSERGNQPEDTERKSRWEDPVKVASRVLSR